MKFRFPIVIIDEDYRSENASGFGIRALAAAIERLRTTYAAEGPLTAARAKEALGTTKAFFEGAGYAFAEIVAIIGWGTWGLLKDSVKMGLLAVPEKIATRAYERHVDVSWTPSNTADDLLAYRIYRSRDEKTFEPIGTQQGSRSRLVDFTGEPPREAVYRVTALDLAGNESAPSPMSKRATFPACSVKRCSTVSSESTLPCLSRTT